MHDYAWVTTQADKEGRPLAQTCGCGCGMTRSRADADEAKGEEVWGWRFSEHQQSLAAQQAAADGLQ